MKPLDIESGKVVFTNKGYFLVIGDIIVNRNEYIYLSSFDDSFCSKTGDLRIKEILDSEDGVIDNMLLGINLKNPYKLSNIKTTNVFDAIEYILQGFEIKSLSSGKSYRGFGLKKGSVISKLGLGYEEIEGNWLVDLNY